MGKVKLCIEDFEKLSKRSNILNQIENILMAAYLESLNNIHDIEDAGLKEREWEVKCTNVNISGELLCVLMNLGYEKLLKKEKEVVIKRLNGEVVKEVEPFPINL